MHGAGVLTFQADNYFTRTGTFTEGLVYAHLPGGAGDLGQLRAGVYPVAGTEGVPAPIPLDLGRGQRESGL